MPYSVLIVDDEESIRSLCEDLLSRWGYETASAINGFDGLEKVKNGSFDIVLTDISMPGCDGITFLEKARDYDPQLEIIVMTACGTIDIAVDAMKKGASDFLLKPLSFHHMAATLRKCAEKLELARENKELNEVNQKLRELNEKKEKFINITGHELKTPVSNASAFVELLMDYMVDNKDEVLSELLGELYSVIEELVSIVNNMHDLSALDKGWLKLDIREFDMISSISKITQEFSPVLKQRNMTLTWTADKEQVFYRGDRRRINQILRELIQNAVKFTPDGGRVEVSLFSQENDTLIIQVKDNGIGIPGDKLTDIFEKFYEIQDIYSHSTSKTSFMGGGMGIGLSLVKEIITAHRGHILVESELEKGSLFTVELPLS